jgi:hypothetical protein
MKLKLSEWASIAEIFAGIAVAVSLVFVGIQIRGSIRATQAGTLGQQTATEVDLLLSANASPDRARVYALAMNGGDFSDLELEDKLQALLYVLATLKIYQGYYLQHQSGALSDSGWEAQQGMIDAWVLTLPDDETLYSRGVSPLFLEYIRQVRNEAGL